MQTTGKKRRISTCIPCYNRKQKCNRQYPCNHCTRRRRPSECVYATPPVTKFPTALPFVSEEEHQTTDRLQQPRVENSSEDTHGFPNAPPKHRASVTASTYDRRLALLKSFGYSEDSNSNTMALLKMWDPCGMHRASLREPIPSDIMDGIQRDLDRMPHRPILDFLIQYFVAELNWMKQIVHAPTFLMRYQQWWNLDRPLSIADTEFAVLILRICSYAAQFLPSHSHTIDSIDRLPLSGIRNACNEVGNSLAHACVTLDWNGSLTRVQHLLFFAIKLSCEGRTDMFWEAIGAASQAAQKAGIHEDRSEPGNNHDELENEMRRRVFCSLYILDSHLARQLDRVPFLPNNVVAGNVLPDPYHKFSTAQRSHYLISDRSQNLGFGLTWQIHQPDMLPCMHLAADENLEADTDAPDPFTERLMQLRLGCFWRRHGTKRNLEYNPTQAQQVYEDFCSEYLSALAPVFALKPETKWDKRSPRLPMQRQLLYICIFDSICWHFRPLLLLKPDQIASLPLYKQILLQSQKKILAIAALKELEAIHALHSLFNGSHTRFAAITFNTFEACVLLLTLCTHPGFPLEGQNDGLGFELGLENSQISRARLIQAAEKGLERLQMLAEINDMAASGAETLSQLFTNITQDTESSGSSMISDTSSWSALLPGPVPDMIGFDFDAGYMTSSGGGMDVTSGIEPVSLVAPEAYPGLSPCSLKFVQGLSFD